MAVAVEVEESLAAKFPVLLPHLDERQRRLYLGSEARSLGHGGVEAVARAAGVSRQMVAAGVAELEGSGEPLGRARRPGGGRKKLADTDPGLRPALLALVDPASRGDPESPLRWTTLSLRNLAAELARQGRRAGPDTVAGLLKEEGFSLQGNAKTAGGARHPDRDAQFRYISAQARDHLAAGQPVISVDAKKKQNVGNFKNGGREWRPEGSPEPVNVYDFTGKQLGKVTPYGVYDVGANTGWVSVGTDHDTAAFAVQTIRTWWQKAGQPAYPAAARLLICADGGGSNGYRTRLWKTELAALAARDRPADHRLPLPAGHLQVEQNRAPAVLPDLDELARPAADQPRGHRADDRGHHHPHRADRRRRTRPRRVPQGHQDLRPPDEGPGTASAQAPPVPRRMELRPDPHSRPITRRVIHRRALTWRGTLTLTASEHTSRQQ